MANKMKTQTSANLALRVSSSTSKVEINPVRTSKGIAKSQTLSSSVSP